MTALKDVLIRRMLASSDRATRRLQSTAYRQVADKICNTMKQSKSSESNLVGCQHPDVLHPLLEIFSLENGDFYNGSTTYDMQVALDG